MPRYVILRHETPPGRGRPLHWDFMLQAGDVLRTWALAEEPRAGSAIAAEPLADHRPHYLDYQGPVSGDRGTVTQWDAGTFQWLRDSAEEVVVSLNGRCLDGIASLRHNPQSSPPWEFSFVPQEQSNRS
jgi:hypothetical protein